MRIAFSNLKEPVSYGAKLSSTFRPSPVTSHTTVIPSRAKRSQQAGGALLFCKRGKRFRRPKRAKTSTIGGMLNAEDFFGLESMFATGAITLGDVVKGYPTSVDKMARFDRLSLIGTLASMLALPELQANAYRIEAM